MRQEYVLGLLFHPREDYVALVRKARPAWQAGKLNGVGGKIEAGEHAHEAMRREFREEAGIDVPAWSSFAVLRGTFGRVYCFYAYWDAQTDIKSPPDEPVSFVDISRIVCGHEETVDNLRWLILMAQTRSVVDAQITIQAAI